MLRFWCEQFQIGSPYFRYIPRDAFFINIVTRAQFAFDVQLVSFADVSFYDFGQPAPEKDAVPFGTLGHLRTAGKRIAGRAGGQTQRGGGHAVVEISHLGILARVADEHNFVERHVGLLACGWLSDTVGGTHERFVFTDGAQGYPQKQKREQRAEAAKGKSGRQAGGCGVKPDVDGQCGVIGCDQEHGPSRFAHLCFSVFIAEDGDERQQHAADTDGDERPRRGCLAGELLAAYTAEPHGIKRMEACGVFVVEAHERQPKGKGRQEAGQKEVNALNALYHNSELILSFSFAGLRK